jgi:UDP-3-O-[3-hydroxymyristoyl] glucosamine N-acyltransferase
VEPGAGFTLAELAERLEGRLEGEGGRVLSGLRSLEEAGPEHLACLHDPRYREAARASRAGAFLLGETAEAPDERPLLRVKHPYLALARALRLFHPEERGPAHIHPSAHLAGDAELGDEVGIAPLAVVGKKARLGDRVRVGAGSVIGAGCVVGEDTLIHANVTLYPGTRVGARCILHSASVLGSDGYGFATREDGVHEKVPQVGRVIVEDDVEVGAGSTIDRGSLGDTVIGAGTKIDNLVQVAHNVKVGPGCLLVAQSGISGSTSLGRSVVVAGQSGAAGHLSLGDGAVVAAKTAVFKDLPAGARVGGIPAMELGEWRRAAALYARLPEMRREIRRLRQELEARRGPGEPGEKEKR